MSKALTTTEPLADTLARAAEALRATGAFRARNHAVEADTLLTVWQAAEAHGEPPRGVLADFLRTEQIDLRLADAEAWIQVARLIPPETRAEFPRLKWTHLLWAVTRVHGKDEAPTAGLVRTRLEIADDNSLSCAGMVAWVLRGGPPAEDEPHPSDLALEALCTEIPAHAEYVRRAWPVVTALVTMKPRKIA